MTFVRVFNLAIITGSVIASTQVLAKFEVNLINGTEICPVGQPLALSPAEERTNESCVPLSVSCAFVCQQNAPNCSCFNYYANGSCEFFSGSNVNVTYQQGCTLWAVVQGDSNK